MVLDMSDSHYYWTHVLLDIDSRYRLADGWGVGRRVDMHRGGRGGDNII